MEAASRALPAPAAYDRNAPALGVATEQQRKAAGEISPPKPPVQPSGISTEQILQVLGVFLIVIAVSYLILQQRQLQVEIGPQEERLLENETRAGILEELSSADKIPTDLSLKLGKSKATIVEHLETLAEAGFVEKLAQPGKKFVYYRLTRKGKQAMLRRAG